MMMIAALLALLGAAVQPMLSQSEITADRSQRGVAIMCDPAKFRFSIRADATIADLDNAYPIKKIVPVDDLFFRDGLPGWTGQTDILGPLVRYERCGPYTFRLEGAAYNMNAQGESGAYEPFASVTVLRGSGRLYPDDGGVLRLTACDRTLPLARPCPQGYAVRLDARYDDNRKVLQFTETTTSFDDDNAKKEKTSVRRFNVQEDLEMWRQD
jgi:hypothetical protein